ncbi:MAG: TadE family protein [Frankiales bacterium]|nr:TadE family protein [Frankiales bacterium]
MTVPDPVGPDPGHDPVPRRADRGSVTAETAVLMPVLLVVLAAAIGVLACVAGQLRCVDAARAAARVAARGDDAATVRATAERLAPPGAHVTISATADVVEVRVRAQVSPFGTALQGLGSVDVGGRAVAPAESEPR